MLGHVALKNRIGTTYNTQISKIETLVLMRLKKVSSLSNFGLRFGYFLNQFGNGFQWATPSRLFSDSIIVLIYYAYGTSMR